MPRPYKNNKKTMKKLTILPILALFCLPIQGFSQDCNTPITEFPWRISFDYVGQGTDVFPPCVTSELRPDNIPYWRKNDNNRFVEAGLPAQNASTPPRLLFMPKMTIPEGSVLNFLHSAGLITVGNLLIRDVMISTTDKEIASFTTIASFPNSVMPQNPVGSWSWATVDLSDYAGQTVYIAFAQRGAMDSWRLQEIEIREGDAKVTALFPEEDATKVPVDATLSVTFNKAVAENDFSKITITPAVTGVSARIEHNKLLISHDGFLYDTEYTVTIPPETIEHFISEVKWTFKTYLPPIDVASVVVSPENTNSDVALDAPIRMIFDIDIVEDINFDNISISPAVAGVEAFYRNKTLAIFSRNFAPNTTYTVTVPARAIDRLRNDVVWTFTTTEQGPSNNQNVFIVAESNVVIWPNPSSGIVYVKVGETSTVTVFDMNGRQLSFHRVAANSELTLKQNQGIYLIRVENHLGTTTHKVIVQ
jgi:hypothetical protein